MNNQDRHELKKANHILIQSNDPRFNYGFHKDIDNIDKIPQILNIAQYDYGFVRKKGDDKNMDEIITATELASFQNLEDMEEYYRQKFPSMPDEYYGIMARYSTGNPITKKEVKNNLKKNKKNPNKQLPIGYGVAHGQFVVNFD